MEDQEETVERKAELASSAGLHVRPARELSDEASKFESSISIRPGEDPDAEEVDAKSIMQLLTLGAPKGSTLVVSASGKDARQAVERLSDMIENTWN